jgi:hypothetical protein
VTSDSSVLHSVEGHNSKYLFAKDRALGLVLFLLSAEFKKGWSAVPFCFARSRARRRFMLGASAPPRRRRGERLPRCAKGEHRLCSETIIPDRFCLPQDMLRRIHRLLSLPGMLPRRRSVAR